MSAKSHGLISGTGRAEATFLAQLLTELGIDTGNGQYLENYLASLKHGKSFISKKNQTLE
jgi:hypothetical protein